MDAEKDICGARWGNPVWRDEPKEKIDFSASDRRAFDRQSLDVPGHAVFWRENSSDEVQTGQE